VLGWPCDRFIRICTCLTCSGSSAIEVGVIYPDLPLLTRLNSPTINADGYPIG
jgi:hypothetical protein